MRLLGCLVVCVALPAAAAPVDRIIGEVGDEPVLLSELKARLATTPPSGDKGRVQKVLEGLLESRLLAARAARAGITVSDDEVERALAEVRRQNGLDEARFADALAKKGMTLDGYRATVREQILEMKVVRPEVGAAQGDEAFAAARRKILDEERRRSGATVELPRPDELAAAAQGVFVVGAVELRGLKAEAREELSSRLPDLETRTDGAEVSELLRKLFATGRVARLAARLEPLTGERARLIIDAAERPYVARVTVEGGVPGCPGEEAGRLRWRALSQRRLRQAVATAERDCAAAGYREAKIAETVALSADLRSAEIKLKVAPGPRLVLRGVEIRGHRALAAREYLARMDTDGGKVNVPGKAVDDQRLEDDAQRMAALLYDHGFINGRVEKPRIEKLPGGREVRVVFEVSEGDVYGLSRLELVAEPGVGDLAAERALLRARAGETFSRSTLAADIERVRKALERRGVRAEVTPETQVDQDSRTVSVLLRVSRSGAP